MTELFVSFMTSPWGFGIVLVICLLLAYIANKSMSIKLSNQGLEIGKLQKQQKVSPHASCPYARDIMEIIHRTIDYSEKKSQLKIDLLEDQMNYYEEVEEEVQNELKRIFLGILSKKLKEYDSFIQHPEYNSYLVTLKAISSDVKNYVRSCFRSNHYASLSIEDQQSYIERKITIIVQKTSEMLNLYWRGTIISREDLRKENLENVEKIEKLIRDMFNKAFMLARETQEKFEDMEKSYNFYLKNTIGESNI